MGIRTAIALELASQKARRDTRDLEEQVRLLEHQLGRLALASVAMAEILRDHLGISGELIEAKIHEIDLRDGKLDGTFHPLPKTCKECGRVSGPICVTCVYCGAMLPNESLLVG
jgi:hypothetical protein